MFIRKTNNHGQDYLSIAKKVKEKGKWKVKYIYSLGSVEKLKTIIPDPKLFFDEMLQKILENISSSDEDKEDDFIKPKEATDKINLGSYYIRWALGLMGIPDFLKQLQKSYDIDYDLNTMFTFLVEAQIIDPSSFLHSIENEGTYLNGTNIYWYDVYRSLDIFAEHCEKIQAEIYSHLDYDREKIKNIYADGTNVYFESEGDESEVNEQGEIIVSGLRSNGFSKENRPLPLVNLELLSYSDGMPLAFCIFPGRESEKVHLVPLLNELRHDFHLYNFRVCADRGNYTGNVIAGILAVDKTLDYQAESYIIGIPIRQGNADLKDWALKEKGYRYILIEGPKKSGPFYLKYKYRIISRSYDYLSSNGKNQKFNTEQAQFLYESNKYSQREKHKRDKKVKEAIQMLQKPSQYNAKKNSGAAGFIKEDYFVETTGEHATVQQLHLDKEKIKKQESLDGLYVIATNDLDLMPLTIRHLYRHLTYIEDDFRDLKSVLKLRPVYVRKPSHILAHFLIEIVSLQVLQIFKNLLNDFYTVPQIAESLRDFNCFKIDNKTYFIPYDNPVIRGLREISNIGFNKKTVNLSTIKSEAIKKGRYVTIRIK